MEFQDRKRRLGVSATRAHSHSLTKFGIQDLNVTTMANQHNFTEQQQAQQPQAAAGEAQDVTAAAQSTEQQPLAQMSELDRFGLAGLLRMIHSDS